MLRAAYYAALQTLGLPALARRLRDGGVILCYHNVAPAGDAPDRADTEMLVHLIAVAAFGDAIVGRRLWRSAGLPATDDTDGRFRGWLAALIREHSLR